MKRKKQQKKFATSHRYSFLKTYWIHLLFVFFLANYVITRSVQLYFYAQSCLTKAQVAADSRCLYIYGNNVYEKGTKNKPHKGHTCGIDVTSFIPAFHIQDMATYMDPTLVGSVCSNQPPTPTPIPPTNTPVPPTATPIPQPTTTPQPIYTPTAIPNQPTATPRPTATPVPNQPTNTPTRIIQTTQPSATPIPTQKLSPTQKVTVSTPTTTPILTPTPIKLITNPGSSGFGKFVPDQGGPQTPRAQQTKVTTTLAQSTAWSPIIMLSQSLVMGSFFLLVGITVLGIIKGVLGKLRSG